MSRPYLSSAARNSPVPLTRQQLVNHSGEADDFKIGDRVFVGGIKPGIIAYIGEVQFSSGCWAGVVLDSAVGKNDGSVNGVRYFMCEPRRGIFSNLSKLSKYYNASLSTSSSKGTDSPDNASDKSSQKSSSSSSKSEQKQQKMLKNMSERATPSILTTPNKPQQHNNVTNPILNPGTTADGSCRGTPNTNNDDSINSYYNSSNNSSLNVLDININSSVTSPGSAFSTPSQPSVTPLSALPRRKTSVGSNSSHGSGKQLSNDLTNNQTSDSSAANLSSLPFKLGDHVVVSGSKNGIVKFIGEAEFAKGVWVGVDLREPLGKNDGSVAGKRYFQCTPMHGLFAPIHKVEICKVMARLLPTSATPAGIRSQQQQQHRQQQQQQQNFQHQPHQISSHRYQIKNQLSNINNSSNNNLMTASWSNNTNNSNNNIMNSRGSQESISSIGSAASSASRRLKLGVTSLGNPLSRSKGSMYGTSTLSVLQKALKEKEEHVEQLIKERDLDRSEFIKTAAQVDEMESQLMLMQSEKKKYEAGMSEELERAKELICKLESSKADLKMQLIEEKRKLEDMQFSLEELNIEKHDIQSQLDKDARRLKELDEKLKNEMNMKDKLSNELKSLKLIDMDKDDPVDEYLDQIEELTHKLCTTENKLRALEVAGVEIKSVNICKSCCKDMDSLAADSNNDEMENGGDDDQSNGSLDITDHHHLHKRLLVENRKLNNQLKLLNQQKIFVESEKTELEGTVKKVSAEKELIEMELNNLIDEHKKLIGERDKLAREKSSNQKLMQETGVQIRNFEQMVEKLTADYTGRMDEMKQKSEAAELEVQVLQLQIQQLTPYKKQVEDLTNQMQALNNERDAIIMEMQKLKLALLDKKQSENNQHERFARSNKDSCTEDQMKEKDSTIKSLQKEVFRLNDELKNTKVPILPQVNDQEIKLLQLRIKQLEKVIHDNQVNNNNANNNNVDNINNNNGESTDAGRLKQEKEAAVSQIDFLNAVIVDLQRKNTDLENKVQLLESSKSMTDSALEKFLASDANLTNIRPFCDICDMFDQHDTEDCPKQNGGGGVGSSGTSPMNASHYHGDPNEERPYCTTCEVFGHNLDQCKEEQTY